MNDFANIPDLFRWQAARLGPRPGLRYKRHGTWTDVSWSEWSERVDSAALGLIELGVQKGDRVAILSENRLEWILADLAILSAGAVTVPLHASLAAEQIQQMLADSGAVAIIVPYERQAAKVRAIAGRTDLRIAILLEPCDPLPLRCLSWESLERLSSDGSKLTLQPDDLASLIYTSGTTGLPKGVMLTHGNFLANASAMLDALGGFSPGAVAFNWLPLSHVYGRTVDYYVTMLAGESLVLGESPETVVADLLEVKPMHLSSVPRFYEKLLGSLSDLPVEQRHVRLRHVFGPRIRWLGCGGAALPRAIAEEYQAAGLEVIVGYGLTESSPVIATNAVGANKVGTVGRPLPGVEIQFAADSEILTRGPHVMAGYWRQPEATAAAIHDGWLRTGDLGRLDADGYLTITGRKKDLIVLSSGKNVAPTMLEGLLLASPLIEQVVIFGEGRPFLTAVVVPRDPATTRAALMEEVERLLENVAPWEKVRKIVVAPRAFSVGSDELTVSMKLRRPAIFENYRAELEELYR